MIPSVFSMKLYSQHAVLAAFIATYIFNGTVGFAASDFQISTKTGLEIEQEKPAKAKKPKSSSTTSGENQGPTVITCITQTTFDEKTRVAVFEGDVNVTAPQFTLTSKKLTAYLKKDQGAQTSSEASNSGSEADAASASTGGLDKAVAEGDVVITQVKPNNDGAATTYIGKAAKAVYNTSSGEVMLTGWPQVQQGVNNQVATEEGTVMIMTQDGRMRTMGKSKTIIQNQSDIDKKKRTASSPEQATAQP